MSHLLLYPHLQFLNVADHIVTTILKAGVVYVYPFILWLFSAHSAGLSHLWRYFLLENIKQILILAARHGILLKNYSITSEWRGV